MWNLFLKLSYCVCLPSTNWDSVELLRFKPFEKNMQSDTKYFPSQYSNFDYERVRQI